MSFPLNSWEDLNAKTIRMEQETEGATHKKDNRAARDLGAVGAVNIESPEHTPLDSSGHRTGRGRPTRNLIWVEAGEGGGMGIKKR